MGPRQPEARAVRLEASAAGDADHDSLLIAQESGLIHDLPAAGEIVERTVSEAEAPSTGHLPKLVAAGLTWSLRGRALPPRAGRL